MMAGRPRKQLPMSDEEIRREYRLAKNPAKQIKILADENDVSRETIRRIVCEKPSPPPKLSGFVPFQELAEKQKEKEKDNMPEDESIPLRVSAEGELPSETPTWHPLPSAPPQAAADFDEAAPKQRDEAPQETAEAAVARSIKEASMPLLSAQTHFPREPWPWASSEDSAGACVMPDAPAAAGEGGGACRISGKEQSRMWHILGRLQGVLEASAEAGRPGEVMKDACDELEVILRGIQQDAG